MTLISQPVNDLPRISTPSLVLRTSLDDGEIEYAGLLYCINLRKREHQLELSFDGQIRQIAEFELGIFEVESLF